MAKKLTFKQVKRFVLDHLKENHLEVNDRYKKHYMAMLKEATGINGLVNVIASFYNVDMNCGRIQLINIMMVDKKKKKK
jgi:hypothetical protein